jgi:hypothetical protein
VLFLGILYCQLNLFPFVEKVLYSSLALVIALHHRGLYDGLDSLPYRMNLILSLLHLLLFLLPGLFALLPETFIADFCFGVFLFEYFFYLLDSQV